MNKLIMSFGSGILLNIVTLLFISPATQYVIKVNDNTEIRQIPVVIGSTLGYTTLEVLLLKKYVQLDTQIQSNNSMQNNNILKQKILILNRLQHE